MKPNSKPFSPHRTLSQLQLHTIVPVLLETAKKPQNFQISGPSDSKNSNNCLTLLRNELTTEGHFVEIAMASQIKPSHYEILGLSVNSTKAEITSAYKKAARQWHPDKAGPDGHAMFIKCKEAYELLLPSAAEPKDIFEEVDSPQNALANRQTFQ